MNSLERKELAKVENLLLEAVSSIMATNQAPSQMSFSDAKTMEAYFCLKHMINRGAYDFTAYKSPANTSG